MYGEALYKSFTDYSLHNNNTITQQSEHVCAVHFIEPSHDLNIHTVFFTDVFMAEWSEHKTEDLRRDC